MNIEALENSRLCFFSGKMIGIPDSIWKEKKCDIQKRLFYALETINTSADNLLPSNLFPGVAKNSVAAIRIINPYLDPRNETQGRFFMPG